MIIQDAQGRDVTVTQTATGWLYQAFGMSVEFPERSDAKALEELNMHAA